MILKIESRNGNKLASVVYGRHNTLEKQHFLGTLGKLSWSADKSEEAALDGLAEKIETYIKALYEVEDFVRGCRRALDMKSEDFSIVRIENEEGGLE